jgi:hypothetical protein
MRFVWISESVCDRSGAFSTMWIVLAGGGWTGGWSPSDEGGGVEFEREITELAFLGVFRVGIAAVSAGCC